MSPTKSVLETGMGPPRRKASRPPHAARSSTPSPFASLVKQCTVANLRKLVLRYSFICRIKAVHYVLYLQSEPLLGGCTAAARCRGGPQPAGDPLGSLHRDRLAGLHAGGGGRGERNLGLQQAAGRHWAPRLPRWLRLAIHGSLLHH